MRECKPVLLVEDDDVDAMAVERAFKELNISNPLIRAGNGEEALAYLKTKSNQKPCVVLLDLNMPKMNGAEFLKAAKADASAKEVPVVVLTTSEEQYDIHESFKNGVAGYIVKPVDYKKFVEAIRTIRLYWTLSELPNDN